MMALRNPEFIDLYNKFTWANPETARLLLEAAETIAVPKFEAPAKPYDPLEDGPPSEEESAKIRDGNSGLTPYGEALMQKCIDADWPVSKIQQYFHVYADRIYRRRKNTTALAIGIRGSWFARTQEDESLPCVHDHWRKGKKYHDEYLTDMVGKTIAFVHGLKTKKKAIVTTDEVSYDDQGNFTGFRRTGYDSIWTIDNVEMRPDGLHFDFVSQVK